MQVADVYLQKGDMLQSVEAYDNALDLLGHDADDAASIFLKKGLLLKHALSMSSSADRGTFTGSVSEGLQSALNAFESSLQVVQERQRQDSIQFDQHGPLDLEAVLCKNIGEVSMRIPGKEQYALDKLRQSLSMQVEKSVKGFLGELSLNRDTHGIGEGVWQKVI